MEATAATQGGGAGGAGRKVGLLSSVAPVSRPAERIQASPPEQHDQGGFVVEGPGAPWCVRPVRCWRDTRTLKWELTRSPAHTRCLPRTSPPSRWLAPARRGKTCGLRTVSVPHSWRSRGGGVRAATTPCAVHGLARGRCSASHACVCGQRHCRDTCAARRGRLPAPPASLTRLSVGCSVVTRPVNACVAIANIVKSSLGPVGLDKVRPSRVRWQAFPVRLFPHTSAAVVPLSPSPPDACRRRG